MKDKSYFAAAAAVLIAIAAAGPANALSVVAAPRNSDGSQRFSDPDAAFDQQLEAYENGRPGAVWGLGDGVSSPDIDRAPRERVRNDGWGRDRYDYSCIECSSVLVDGVWVLRHDEHAEDVDPAPAR